MTVDPEGAAWSRVRRLLFVQAFLVIASLAVLVGIWFAVQRLQVRRDALVAQNSALEARNRDLQEQNGKLEQDAKGLSDSLVDAEQQYKHLQKGLADAAKKARSFPQLQRAIDTTLETATAATPPAAAPRIHILYAGENQRERAAQLGALLQERAYTVRTIANIERTGGRPANDMTQVRYMHRQDRTSAIDVLNLLAAAGIHHARVSYVPDKATPAGRIEIWFEAGAIR